MAKSNSRYNVNFKNNRVQTVINYLQLAENKMSREDFIKLGTKDIFYQFKKNNYIQESSKGIFQATKKLRDKIEKQTGSQFGKGSSVQHSKKILEVSKRIPKEIITNRDFKTGTEIEKRFNQFKSTGEYKYRIEAMLKSYIDKIESLNQHHFYVQNSNTISSREKLKENVNYHSALYGLERSASILKDNPCSIPDFCFNATRGQAEQFIENLKDWGVSTHTNTDKAISTIKQILETSTEQVFNLQIEIITNSYGSVDMERHYNFETITNTKVIYI